jgi:hypothetical protein
MDQVYSAHNPTPFSAATGAKTVIKIITPTSFNIKLHEFGIFFDGVTSTAVPATVDLFISDETGAGTSGVTGTCTQIKGATLAHGCTIGTNFTVEGSTYTILRSFYVPQFMGSLILQNPLGIEDQSPAGLADSIGLRVNTTATVNVKAYMKFSRG